MFNYTRAGPLAGVQGDKALKDRWSSVGKTGKLTDAMRLVAAAKVQFCFIALIALSGSVMQCASAAQCATR